MPSVPTRGQQAARIVLAATLILLGLWVLHGFLTALAWAGILAVAVWPVFEWARRRWPPGRRNILLPALFTLVIGLLFIVPLGLIALQLAHDVHDVLRWAHDARLNGIPMPDWVPRLPLGRDAAAWWQTHLSDPEAAGKSLGRLGRGQLLSVSRDLGVELAHRATLFFFMLLALFFLFRDGRALIAQMRVASYHLLGQRGEQLGHQIIASIHGTVDGLVLVGLGEGILIGAAYYVLGVPRPALLGAATVLAAMVPFGAPAVFLIAAAILLTQGSLASAALLAAFGFLVVFVADHAVRPVLIGGSTRLPFLWVLLGILGGVECFGLLGLFVGPAVMATLILLWREWTERPPQATR